MTSIPIFFAVNDNFVKYLCTALESLKEHISNDTEYDIRILYGSLTLENQNLIKAYTSSNIKFSFYNVSSYFPGNLKESFRWSREIYYRLIIPYIFKDLDKALYLDADIIFMEDPRKLYDVDIGDNYLGAVFEPSNKQALGDVRYYKAFESFDNLRINGNYFGSGVLVFNMKAFREHLKFEDIISYIERHDMVYIDQDALNYLCLNHTYGLEPNWNCIYHYHQFQLQLESTGKDMYIYHYAGKLKPDKYALRDKYYLFWKYYKHTVLYSDEEYLKAIANYILDSSDEISLEEIELTAQETFNEYLCMLYVNQVNEWYENGEVLTQAAIYLLLCLSKLYSFEIDERISSTFDYLIEECYWDNGQR